MCDANGKCDKCGQFMNFEVPGASGATIYDFSAMEPIMHELRCWRCSKKFGPVYSNARPADGDMSPYQWHNN